MARIRVDPVILISNSSTISATASGVTTAGNLAQSTAMTAPSYDGQFGPRVNAIGAEASSRANFLTNNLINKGNDLTYRAQLFLNADQISINSMKGHNIGINIPTDSPFNYSTMPVYNNTGVQIGNVEKGKLVILPGVKADSESIFLTDQKNIWQSGPGRPPEPKTAINVKIPIAEYTAYSDEISGDLTILGGIRTGGKAGIELGIAEAGIGVGLHAGQRYAGGYLEATGFKFNASQIIGTTDLGIGVGVELKAGSAEVFGGLKDGTIGLAAGFVIASVEGELAGNIAGKSVGVTGEIGYKFELGLKLGKNSRVYLGPFTIGLKIGEALGS